MAIEPVEKKSFIECIDNDVSTRSVPEVESPQLSPESRIIQRPVNLTNRIHSSKMDFIQTTKYPLLESSSALGYTAAYPKTVGNIDAAENSPLLMPQLNTQLKGEALFEFSDSSHFHFGPAEHANASNRTATAERSQNFLSLNSFRPFPSKDFRSSADGTMGSQPTISNDGSYQGFYLTKSSVGTTHGPSLSDGEIGSFGALLASGVHVTEGVHGNDMLERPASRISIDPLLGPPEFQPGKMFHDGGSARSASADITSEVDNSTRVSQPYVAANAYPTYGDQIGTMTQNQFNGASTEYPNFDHHAIPMMVFDQSGNPVATYSTSANQAGAYYPTQAYDLNQGYFTSGPDAVYPRSEYHNRTMVTSDQGHGRVQGYGKSGYHYQDQQRVDNYGRNKRYPPIQKKAHFRTVSAIARDKLLAAAAVATTEDAHSLTSGPSYNGSENPADGHTGSASSSPHLDGPGCTTAVYAGQVNSNPGQTIPEYTDARNSRSDYNSSAYSVPGNAGPGQTGPEYTDAGSSGLGYVGSGYSAPSYPSSLNPVPRYSTPSHLGPASSAYPTPGTFVPGHDSSSALPAYAPHGGHGRTMSQLSQGYVTPVAYAAYSAPEGQNKPANSDDTAARDFDAPTNPHPMSFYMPHREHPHVLPANPFAPVAPRPGSIDLRAQSGWTPPSAALARLAPNGNKPSVDEALKIENLPFIELAHLSNPANHGVLLINNIPWNVTRAEILAFLGRNARIVHEANEPIHIIFNRSTGKSEEAYVEFINMEEAANAVNRHDTQLVENRHCRLGNRHVLLELSSQEALMKALFPRSKVDRWNGAVPEISKPKVEDANLQISGNVFLNKEELTMLQIYTKNPSRTPFAHRYAPRTYEHMISVLLKFPWYSVEHVTIADRDGLFKVARVLAEELFRRIQLKEDETELNNRLLRRYIMAVLRCAGFTEAQKDDVVDVCGLRSSITELAPYAEDWNALKVIGPKPGVEQDMIIYYIALIREATTAPGMVSLADRGRIVFKRPSAFGEMGIPYPDEVEGMSFKDVARIEWNAIEALLRKILA